MPSLWSVRNSLQIAANWGNIRVNIFWFFEFDFNSNNRNIIRNKRESLRWSMIHIHDTYKALSYRVG
jgi:hypothetical protein